MSHEFRDVARGYGRMHHGNVALRTNLRNGQKIFQHIKARFVENRVYHRSGADDQQVVAVGRGIRGHFHRDIATGAGAVIHHHRLPQFFAEALCQRTRDGVHAAAGRDADDGAQRARGEFLRLRLRATCKQ